MRHHETTEAGYAESQGLSIKEARAQLDLKIASSQVTSSFGTLNKSPVSNNTDGGKSGLTESRLRELSDRYMREGGRDLNFPDKGPSSDFDAEASATAEKAMYAKAMTAARKTVAALKADPEFAGIDLEMFARTRDRAKPGRSRVDVSIVTHILTSIGASSTQGEIRDAVQIQHPGMTVRKTWTTPLPKWLLTKAQAIAASSGSPFNQIEIKRKVSMSDLHSLAKAAVAGQSDSAREYKATVLIGPDHVFINGVGFKISSKQSGKHTYRTASANIEKLHAALATPLRSRARSPAHPKAAKGAAG